ncbi:hypothetical protein OUZ56_033921 [Daphnia magna]|uniref:Uncharacterized protein n=1 Tax=Daphnia magna TaxID=35525 RepID=A0ABR0BBA8_9CRUS|nr:hypothetical protein OUZ56_033921 [Daphnia magna]
MVAVLPPGISKLPNDGSIENFSKSRWLSELTLGGAENVWSRLRKSKSAGGEKVGKKYYVPTAFGVNARRRMVAVLPPGISKLPNDGSIENFSKSRWLSDLTFGGAGKRLEPAEKVEKCRWRKIPTAFGVNARRWMVAVLPPGISKLPNDGSIENFSKSRWLSELTLGGAENVWSRLRKSKSAGGEKVGKKYYVPTAFGVNARRWMVAVLPPGISKLPNDGSIENFSKSRWLSELTLGGAENVWSRLRKSKSAGGEKVGKKYYVPTAFGVNARRWMVAVLPPGISNPYGFELTLEFECRKGGGEKVVCRACRLEYPSCRMMSRWLSELTLGGAENVWSRLRKSKSAGGEKVGKKYYVPTAFGVNAGRWMVAVLPPGISMMPDDGSIENFSKSRWLSELTFGRRQKRLEPAEKVEKCRWRKSWKKILWRGYLSEIEMKNFLSPYGFWSECRAVDGSRPAAWKIHDAE